MNRDLVILVDELDNEVGTEEKLKAHEEGKLHRAVSAFVFNATGDMLIQKRASTKYHSPGLWSNAACTHPQPNEENKLAAERRLMEEMGFTTPLTFHSTLLYKAPFDNGLTEHEYDHILLGDFNGTPNINPDEVSEWKWMSLEAIEADMKENPQRYTEWFKIIFDKFYNQIER